MTTQNKQIDVFLPDELYQALIAYQKQQKFEEASDAVVKILAQFFHKEEEIKRYATVEQLEALEGKVTYLSKQVTALSQALANSASPQTARTMPTLSNDKSRPEYLAQQPSATFASTSFEEVEDEPDEILHDFL